MNWNFENNDPTASLLNLIPAPTQPTCVGEMCDVCTKNYPSTSIRRFNYQHPRGTLYVIRCCPYCNPYTLIPYLN